MENHVKFRPSVFKNKMYSQLIKLDMPDCYKKEVDYLLTIIFHFFKEKTVSAHLYSKTIKTNYKLRDKIKELKKEKNKYKECLRLLKCKIEKEDNFLTTSE